MIYTRIMIFRHFAIALTLASATDSVAEYSKVKLNTPFVQTSDDFLRTGLQIHYQSSRTDWWWRYPDESSPRWSWEANVNYFYENSPFHTGSLLGLTGAVIREWNEVLASKVTAGIEMSKLIDNGVNRRAKWIPHFEWNQFIRWQEKFFGELKVGNQLSTFQFLQSEVSRLQFQMSYVDFSFLVIPVANELRVKVLTQFWFLGDGNIRKKVDLQAMYGISTYPKWIWIGFGGEWFGFEDAMKSYWSPEGFYSFGPRFEASLPVYHHLSWSTGLNLNLFRERGNNFGFGYYLSSGFVYGKRESTQISLTYSRTSSTLGRGKWESSGIQFSLLSSF